jgi:hypothetical protein
MICTVTVYGASDSAFIKKYSDMYESGIKKYEEDYLRQKQQACMKYINLLKNKQKTLQAAGDLDGWAAFNKEQKRFINKPIVESAVSSPASLRKVQTAYIRHLTQLEQKKNTNTIALRNKYIAKLESLQKKWTKEGDFNAAFAAKDEIRKMKSEAAASLTEESQTSSGQEDNNGANDNETEKVDIKAPTHNITRSDGSVIYPPGISPRAVGLVQKPVVLSRTKASPWPSVISARINVSSDKPGSSSRLGHSTYGTSTASIRVRISVRTSQSGIIKSNIRTVMQYYSKSGSGSSIPSVIATRNVTVPYVASKFVTIDLPPVKVTTSTYRSSSHRRVIGGDSDKIYGYVLSIFDNKGNLLYQGTSRKSMGNVIKTPDMNDGNIEALQEAYNKASQAYSEASTAYHADSCNMALRQAYDAARSKRDAARKAYYSARNSNNCCH